MGTLFLRIWTVYSSNRELWVLVYNGILHSVHVHGAETNKIARNFLGLDIPPQYRR